MTMTAQDAADIRAAIANFDRAHAVCIAAGSCEAAGDQCPGTSHDASG